MSTTTTDMPQPNPVTSMDVLFETDRMDLAVLLICRGLEFVGAKDKDGWKYFQFRDAARCEEVKREYDYSDPLVKLHEYESNKRRLNRIVHS